MNQEERITLAKETLRIIEAGLYVNPTGEVRALELKPTQLTFVHKPGDNLQLKGEGSIEPLIEITHESTIKALMRLKGPHTVNTLGCLNFASGKNPGGGFLWGTIAQEETLAYSSDLYASLLNGYEFYTTNRALLDKGDPPFYSDLIIESNPVVFFRDEEFELLDTPFQAIVITSAAPKTVDIITHFPAHLHEVYDVFRLRMARMFRAAINAGIKVFVVGAWGCGVFKNDPVMVAKLFKENIVKYGKYFNHIVFAIYGTEDDINYKIFKEIIQP